MLAGLQHAAHRQRRLLRLLAATLGVDKRIARLAAIGVTVSVTFLDALLAIPAEHDR